MKKFMSKQKKNIVRSRMNLVVLMVIAIFLMETCSPKKNNNLDQIDTVTRALQLLQNHDSTNFYALIDTSFVIDIKGREGLSNVVENAAYFLKKFGVPKSSKYKVINYELDDYQSVDVIVPIMHNDTSDIKDVKIIFQFVKLMPPTKALNFKLEVESIPSTPITPPPRNN